MVLTTPTMPAPLVPPNTTYSTMKAAEMISSGTTPMSGNSTAMTAVAEMSWEMMLMKVPTELRIEAAMPAPSPYSLRIIPTRVGQPCRRRGPT